ncbi:F0F1 ATP synthase subunit delta [Coraliomargarita akajimensis]|uniref:H+transporting two-sector ATPase delta (OSCP) subunit n=1 Tax=Coraliomargarita akajimensis (strain DSM 45221 / IAM 15411 / JCM 23193 / KCTC 12865 / 04OKA010-24) TaxID=583355 RepID=D5ELJ0_CORAD|nr:F0F1 ATP synthase subunit delta [Coraliomargarita akajimensis]ADE55126.1 H+transporting two-sector ATPase delta (OSCP) subunit [Coraliomargarita akajimensis DSM 45221]
MNADQKINQFAKKLVELSKEDGLIAEAKVQEVLAALKQSSVRYPARTLKAYLRLIRRALAEQTAVVATPGALSADALTAIEANFSKLYDRPIQAVTETDTSLIAGVRVRVGDDLYDASVAGRLERLAQSVN